jgi:outer membrane protein assembly factor BamA
MASGIETLSWYGFGNETARQDESVSFFRVSQNEVSGGLTLGIRFGKDNELSVGPLARWSYTDLSGEPNGDRFIATDRPYGVGRFGLLGARARLELEGRDFPGFASKGAALELEASGYPGWLDAEAAIAIVAGEATLALAPQGSWRPSLHFMAGGVKTWGRLPFFLAPSLGGSHTLRGYRPDRFAGDAALYGSTELRIPLTRLQLIVPGQQGVFGFFDAGRVYFEDESSDEWHTSAGGGLWFSFLTRSSVMYVGVGAPTKDKEGARLVLGFGFPY